jgi:glycosyltransferase involved in cell wall biosynthesis
VTNSQTTFFDKLTRALLRTFAGGHNVMLATGQGESRPAAEMDWIFATALSSSELDHISPAFDRETFNPPRLMYAGRLSEEKGVAYLLKALALLRENGFNRLPTLTIAGDGPERMALHTLAKELNCEDRVVFAGQLNRNELFAQFDQSDLCIQPSLTEGFSKAWLDAMAHGLPVLASEVGAARAVIGKNMERGWLVPPGDVDALARSIREAVTGAVDWPALRRRCRAYVEGLTLEAWAEKIGQNCARRWNVSLVKGKLCG